MNNVEVSFLGDEIRPAIILDDVKGIEISNVKAQRAGTAPILLLKNVSDFNIHESRGIKDKAIKQTAEKTF
jgi:hypothetical protein